MQAIEIRLLGLGDEPLPPVMKTPTYLGNGRARIEWSLGGFGVDEAASFSKGQDLVHHGDNGARPMVVGFNLEKDAEKFGDNSGIVPSSPMVRKPVLVQEPVLRDAVGLPESEMQKQGGEAPRQHVSYSSHPPSSAVPLSSLSGSMLGSVVDGVSTSLGSGGDRAEMGQDSISSGSSSSSSAASVDNRSAQRRKEEQGGTGERQTEGGVTAVTGPERKNAATFPVHKYVLERSCLHVDAVRASKSQQTSNSASAAGSVPAWGAGVEVSDSRALVSGTTAAEEGWGGSGGVGGVMSAPGVSKSRGGGFGGGVGGEEWVTVHPSGFVGFKTTGFFEDSGLLPGRTYVYR